MSKNTELLRTASRSQLQQGCRAKDAYSFASGVSEISTSDEIGMLFALNTQEEKIAHIERLVISAAFAVNPVARCMHLRIYKNVTVLSPIVSGELDAPILSNKFFGEPDLDPSLADIFRSGAANSIIDGDVHREFLLMVPLDKPVVIDMDEIVPPGESIAVSVEILNLNTALSVIIELEGYFRLPVD